MVRAPLFALAMMSIVALAAAPQVHAQAGGDPRRTPDATFLAKAADGVAADTELATLAATRARAAAVKAFAKQVLDTGSAIAGELAAMGRSPKVTIPSSPDGTNADARKADAAKAVARLLSQPPPFDAAYVAAMVASREAAVALFEAESRDGRDGEIKEWAARQLPALRDQLAAARALRPRPGP